MIVNQYLLIFFYVCKKYTFWVINVSVNLPPATIKQNNVCVSVYVCVCVSGSLVLCVC